MVKQERTALQERRTRLLYSVVRYDDSEAHDAIIASIVLATRLELGVMTVRARGRALAAAAGRLVKSAIAEIACAVLKHRPREHSPRGGSPRLAPWGKLADFVGAVGTLSGFWHEPGDLGTAAILAVSDGLKL